MNEANVRNAKQKKHEEHKNDNEENWNNENSGRCAQCALTNQEVILSDDSAICRGGVDNIVNSIVSSPSAHLMFNSLRILSVFTVQEHIIS